MKNKPSGMLNSLKKTFTEGGTGTKMIGAFLSVCLALFTVGCLILAGFFGYAKFGPNELDNREIIQPASSQLFDAKGALLTTTDSEEDRLPVSLDKVPKHLQNAFLAAEDIRFYSHGGLDYKGIVRAVYVNITGGHLQGASTITQQLAKNFFLTQERTLSRKVHEALISLQLEDKYTKKEIMEMYLNQIYFGQGAYGVECAANKYFGKHVENLDLAESAMLAGLPKSPNYYSPIDNPKVGKERQLTVLNQMVKYNFITQEQADAAAAQKLVYKDIQSDLGSKKYFVSYCIQLLIDEYGPDAVYKGGLKVYTTLDPFYQKCAEIAAKECPQYYTDSEKRVQPQCAIASVDPTTGRIKAMIGGRGNDKFNRAVLAERQPGSAFKPFVYLNALEQGASPNTMIEDTPIPGSWNPQNYDRRFHGKLTMRTCLINSYNVPAVKVANMFGCDKVVALAKKCGITTLVESGAYSDANPSMALGGLTSGVTPLEMAGAFASFATMGKFNKPTPFLRILDRNGKVIYEHKPQPTQIAKPSSVAMLVDMMRDVMTRGTGGGACIARPCAGKTGTTSEYKDAWFVGYTPNMSTAVWIGDDNGEYLPGMTGGAEPATIWNVYMTKACEQLPYADFEYPSNFSIPAPIADIGKKDEEKDKDKLNKIIRKRGFGSDITSGKLPGAGNNQGTGTIVPKPPRPTTVTPSNPKQDTPQVNVPKPTPKPVLPQPKIDNSKSNSGKVKR